VDGNRIAGERILPDDVRRQLDRIGSADVLVGIPCFNNAGTIGHVVTAVEAGLRKFFPDLRAVICASDGGSEDGTLDVVRSAEVGDRVEPFLVPRHVPVPRKLGFPYRGTPGKGSAFRSIFEVARRLDVRACAVVDADLRSINPYWLDRLLTPVVHHGYEFVAPIYARHKYDGTITNSLAYPVTTALYGTRLRQPIGGEFAFTGELAGAYADEDVWDTDVARFGVDVWMTTVAVVRGARVCQGMLGAKLHDPKDPAQHLGPMFRQVVGSLFALAGRYRHRWVTDDRVVTPPTFGFPAAYSAEPIEVSVTRLHWKFVDGYVRNRGLWGKVLSSESMETLDRAVSQASERRGGLVLEPDGWLRIVYDFLIAYNTRVEEPGPLLDALIPLYFARTATFIAEVAEDSQEQAEVRVEAMVEAAIRLRPYLEQRWQEEAVPARPLQEQPVPTEEGEDVEAGDALVARTAT
jgi:glycosyltransferase involved in cell wall biosynthesis